MTHTPDYHSVEIDSAKDPTDYHYTERRAELLSAIEQHGDPYTINQSQAARRYGVDQSTISRDIDKLGKHINEVIGDHAETVAYTTFKAALAECDDAREKFDLAMRWQKWLQSTGRQETAPARAEIEATHVDGDSSDSYEIIADDDTIEAEGEVVDVASIRTGSAESPAGELEANGSGDDTGGNE